MLLLLSHVSLDRDGKPLPHVIPPYAAGKVQFIDLTPMNQLNFVIDKKCIRQEEIDV